MSDQTRDIVQAVGRRLDDARDLLDAAVEQATALERSLRGHENTVNDVHWDAAKLLLEPQPGRPTLHLVHTKAADLADQLRHSTTTADQIHDKLIAAGQQLQHTDRLIGALAADSTDSTESTDPERATAVAALSSRAERLSTLVAAATPLADRAHQQLGSAREALEQGVRASSGPGLDEFQQFWTLDRGVYDSSRDLASAHTRTRDGAELTEHAARTGTLTAAHARDLLRHHQPGHPPAPTVHGPSGPAI